MSERKDRRANSYYERKSHTMSQNVYETSTPTPTPPATTPPPSPYMARNPFDERPPAKKRNLNVNLTEDQYEAFNKLQEDRGFATAAALVKALLKQAIDEEVALATSRDR